jgi:predicted phage terminase large subunit-like protein
LNHKLIEVEQGRIKRLMVFMPPRHFKSETISKYFSAWFIGNNPNKRIILTSYEADFAATWGYKARTVLEEHQTDFGCEIDQHSKARNRWDTTDGGGMVTAGVGGPITGKGADILIIDDPVKNAEEAQSQTYRDKAWDWFLSTSYTRLEPDATIILIMTRWHEDDLAGRILERSNEDWDVIVFPALAEKDDPLNRQEGQALCSERYNKQRLLEIKQEIGEYWFNALYQQSPLPPTGGMFKREDFKPLIETPKSGLIKQVRFWDLAATLEGDYTAGLLLNQYNDGTYFIEDVQRLRGTPKQVEDRILQTAASDGRNVMVRMEQEPGSSGVNVIAHYTRLLAGYDFKGIKSTGSKEIRAGPVAAQVEASNVFYLIEDSWNNDFLNEVTVFPFGANDDMVDSLSGSFNELFEDKRKTWTVMG